MIFYPTEDNVKITGRTLVQDKTRYLSFSGSSISFTFTGKKAEICLWTDCDNWEKGFYSQIAVFLNDEPLPSKRFPLFEKEKLYTLYESSEEQTVTITLMKFSEAAFGKCGIKYIQIDTDRLLPPPMPKKRKLEIIGDSITCGYGIDAANETEPFTTDTENPLDAYSLQLAKMLDADVQLVSWSGIGIISCYVPETEDTPLDDWLMPMLYEYTDAAGSKDIFKQEQDSWEIWNNKRFIPDLILINIGTNDASYCREHKDRQDTWGSEYEKFIAAVRRKNPDIPILCVLGTMDQRLCCKAEEIVNKFRTVYHDTGVQYLHLPLQLDEDGKGADFHPSRITHKKTAQLLSEYITSNILQN